MLVIYELLCLFSELCKVHQSIFVWRVYHHEDDDEDDNDDKCVMMMLIIMLLYRLYCSGRVGWSLTVFHMVIGMILL